MGGNGSGMGDAWTPAPPIRERAVGGVSGWAMVVVLLEAAGIALLATGAATRAAVAGGLLVVAGVVLACGLTPVTPGEARVVQLLGRYTGTVRTDGLRWVNPLTRRRRISTRIRNHETATAKVNDADGNPIEIAAVVVWRVVDTAKALFGVDDYAAFVAVQTETAVRHIAGRYPYDAHGEGQRSLRENAREITVELAAEIADRVVPAGVEVIESRITRLAYAPEIAQAMLRRQQASAVVAARQRIVEGAVSMVSNMLVVLCSEHPTQPVVNTGTLYR